jgi:hypothetical protein
MKGKVAYLAGAAIAFVWMLSLVARIPFFYRSGHLSDMRQYVRVNVKPARAAIQAQAQKLLD